VLVVVLAVSGVPAPVVNVVDVILVRDRDMATSLTVNMVMRLVHRVPGWFTFVVVTVVRSMKVTVVHVVDMIPVRDRDVTASFAVHMIVIEVLVVDCARHRFLTAVPDLIRALNGATKVEFNRATGARVSAVRCAHGRQLWFTGLLTAGNAV
jgi:hypothetical protein